MSRYNGGDFEHSQYRTFNYLNMNGLCWIDFLEWTYKYVYHKADLHINAKLIRKPTRLTSLICWRMICRDYQSRIYIQERKWLQPTLPRKRPSFENSSQKILARNNFWRQFRLMNHVVGNFYTWVSWVSWVKH